MMILDEESFTNIDTELCPDGLDAGVYDVMMFMVFMMFMMFMMILDKESFTDIDTELGPDGLDAGVDLLLMPHQGDPQLHQLVQAQPRHLVHARHSSSSKVVRVPKYFCVKCFANFFIKFFQLHIFQFLSNFSNFW